MDLGGALRRVTDFTGILPRMPVVRIRRRCWATILLLPIAITCDRAPARRAATRETPTRIVSLNPTTTEMVFALGAGSRLVGRTHWDSYPPEASAVPDLGPGMSPNVEAVVAARPDLVLLYASGENEPAARQLSGLGLHVVSLRINTIAEFEAGLEKLGELVGEGPRAAELVRQVQSTLDSVRRATAPLPHWRVFLPAWESPLLAIGGGSFLSELVDIAGGANIFADLAQPSPPVSFEEVLRRSPDVILTGPVDAANILASPRWRALRAVRDARVLVYDTALVARPSVRMGAAAVSLARLLHPVPRS